MAAYSGPVPARDRTFAFWFRPALASGLLPEDFETRQSTPKDAEYAARIGADKLRSWRAYVWLQRHEGLPRHRRFERWVWEQTPREKACALGRSRNRARFEREGLVQPGDGREIDHVDGDCTNNARSNLRVVDACAHNLKHGRACELRRPERKAPRREGKPRRAKAAP